LLLSGRNSLLASWKPNLCASDPGCQAARSAIRALREVWNLQF